MPRSSSQEQTIGLLYFCFIFGLCSAPVCNLDTLTNWWQLLLVPSQQQQQRKSQRQRPTGGGRGHLVEEVIQQMSDMRDSSEAA